MASLPFSCCKLNHGGLGINVHLGPEDTLPIVNKACGGVTLWTLKPQIVINGHIKEWTGAHAPTLAIWVTHLSQKNVSRILKTREKKKKRLRQKYCAQPICLMFMATERHSQFCTDSRNNEAFSESFLKNKNKNYLTKEHLSQKH